LGWKKAGEKIIFAFDKESYEVEAHIAINYKVLSQVQFHPLLPLSEGPFGEVFMGSSPSLCS